MSIETLYEQPKKLDFIALSYVEQIADDYSYELLPVRSDETSWEIELQCPVLGDKSMGVPLPETQLFVSAVIEFLDDNYPQYEWKDMISLTNHDDVCRIKFETKISDKE